MSDQPGNEQLQQMVDCDREVEQACLEQLYGAGWDIGCWLRADAAVFVDPSDPTSATLLEQLAQRSAKGVHGEVGGDQHPDGLAHAPIEGDDPCWIVTSQRCDLIKSFRAEPLVEVAAARRPAGEDVKTLWKSSSSWSPIDPGEKRGFIVDLRTRRYLPKLALTGYVARQALPRNTDDAPLRTRFVHRLGQRYTRPAIPASIGASVVAPVKQLLAADGLINDGCSDVLLARAANGSLQLTFVTRRDITEHEYRELERHVDLDMHDALVAPGIVSNVKLVPMAQISADLWFSAWKLDLDFLSFADPEHSAAPTT